MKYNAHIPGNFYALGPIITADGNRYASTEKEARAGLRAWLGLNRLPNGTEVCAYEGGQA